MKYYAMMVDLTSKKCLVVGGGKVAERKVHALFEAGADVIVVSPVVTQYIEKCALNDDITWHKWSYSSSYIENFFLIIAATDSKDVNYKVYQDAKKRDQWINVVDNPELSNFTVPSIVRRGNLHISISTNGSSPSLSKRIKKDLEELYGEEYAFYLSLMEGIRLIVKRDIHNLKKRSQILNELASPMWIESFSHNPLAALKQLQEWIEQQKKESLSEKIYCG